MMAVVHHHPECHRRGISIHDNSRLRSNAGPAQQMSKCVALDDPVVGLQKVLVDVPEQGTGDMAGVVRGRADVHLDEAKPGGIQFRETIRADNWLFHRSSFSRLPARLFAVNTESRLAHELVDERAVRWVKATVAMCASPFGVEVRTYSRFSVATATSGDLLIAAK